MLLEKSECLNYYLRKQPASYFMSLSESIAFDRELTHEHTREEVVITLNEFLKSKSIANRGSYVSCMTEAQQFSIICVSVGFLRLQIKRN